MNAAGWKAAHLAKAADLDQSAITRLLSGDLRPGQRSIAGLLVAFSTKFPNIGFYDVFDVIDSNGAVIVPEVESPAPSMDGAATAV